VVDDSPVYRKLVEHAMEGGHILYCLPRAATKRWNSTLATCQPS